MKLSRSLGLVFALCVGALSLTACASGSGDKAPSAHDGNVGTLALALTGQTNGTTYRLRNAIFDIAGPTMTTLDSESDPNGAVLATTLATGGYSITLESGWSLEKLGPMGAQTVSAALASPNPTSFMVGSGSTASVVFQFSTDGTIVEIGTGRVEVSIGVIETGATGCNILAQTGCPMGQACYFGGMDGITPTCAQVVDAKPAGQPCMFQNECATPGFCGTPDGMTVECIAACALDLMGPACPAGLTCIDAGLGANIGACL
jgi:hypothetical protein